MVDEDPTPVAGARSLKTAASVLQVLRLLGGHPAGLSPHEVAERLGKSPATARYMVNTLGEAGYAVRGSHGRWRLTDRPPWGSWGAAGDAAPPAVLTDALRELHRRTRRRSYLVRRSATVVASVVDTRGHQGLARLPGLGDRVPPGHAHALAMTKVLLASCPAYREAVEAEPLAARTSRTITDVTVLRAEIDEVRRVGHAVDDEEYADGFATLAAPLCAPSGEVTLALGVSVCAGRLDDERDELVAALTQVAARSARRWRTAVAR